MCHPKFVIIGLVLFSLGVNSEDTCESNQVQIAYVVDNTASYLPFLSCAQDLALKLNKKIKAQYTKSEFSLTKFADYDLETAGPIPVKRGPWGKEPPQNIPFHYVEQADCPYETLERTYCYKKVVNFNSDLQNVENAFKNLSNKTDTYISGGNAESSLTALLFTAVDKTLGWKLTPVGGNKFQKFLIICTEEDTTLQLEHVNNRQDAKGDGNDNCDNHKVPTHAVVQKALHEQDFYVIALVSQGKARPQIERVWDHNLHMLDLPENNKGWVVTCGEGAADKIFDKITKTMWCIDPDPPAYNILGF